MIYFGVVQVLFLFAYIVRRREQRLRTDHCFVTYIHKGCEISGKLNKTYNIYYKKVISTAVFPSLHYFDWT